MYLRIRNLCGWLSILLPWLALLSAGIKPDKETGWWWSISATYYQSDILVGILCTASIILISYIGYERIDNIINKLTGLCGLGIILFPCKVGWIPDGTPVGFFQLPIELSQIFHQSFSILFFLFAAFNSLFLFTRHEETMTDRKKVRNTIYRICGWGMLGIEALLVTLGIIFGTPAWFVMVLEIPLLHLLGFTWLVKGEFFPFLNDKEESAPPSA
jgi:hypothetical protein